MYEQSDFESATFDVTQFVDQLVEKSLSSSVSASSSGGPDSFEFDSAKLYSVLSQTMSDLEELEDKMESELKKQQAISRSEIEDQMHRVQDLESQHARCSEAFIKLENDIIEISKKLVSLGDQLENISQPHTRISEAKFLIANFNQFMRNSFPKDKFESDQSEASLAEFVDLLTKMQLVLAELDESKFQSAAMNIRSAHGSIQNLLIEKFALAIQENDITSMSKFAKLMAKFDCYNQKCVTVFVDRLLSQISIETDTIFEDILGQIQNLESEIQSVFEDSEQIFATFLNRLFLEKIQSYIDHSLMLSSDSKENISLSKGQLEMLSSFEAKMQRFCERLSKQASLVNKSNIYSLKTKLFSNYLSSYMANERKLIFNFCQDLSSSFYSTKNHVKKTPVQLKTFGRKPFSETFDYPALIYQDELIQVVKEVKSSVARAEKLLNSTSDKNDFGNALVELLFDAVFDDNLVYVMHLVSEGTPSTQSDLQNLKVEPFLTYFGIVSRAYSVIAEVNNLYVDYILFNPSSNKGLITIPAHCDELRMKKFTEVENLINAGIEKTLNYYSAWIKKIYSNQNLKEFQQLDDESIMHGPTETCKQVCSFVQQVVNRVSVDLKRNEKQWTDEILLQFGLQFHSNLLAQIRRLQVSLYGGIQISMDLSEYKKVAESFCVPLLMELFSSLQALCNLLITPAEHLSSVINGPELEGFEQTVVHDFVKLRVDYKRGDLSRLFLAPPSSPTPTGA